jgi:peroxiredoxin Q/BCP
MATARPAVGKKIKSFRVETTAGPLASKELAGTPYVLYFYPKDDTPGCTLEGHGFRDQHSTFTRLGVRILGVSRDSLASHEKFRRKHGLPFDLIADSGEALCQQFDVMRDKNMYGKKVRGIERSTFLVDGEGVLRREWRKVKVDGHVAEVLEATKAL